MTNAHCHAGKAGSCAHRFTLPQLLLGAVEVKVDIETLHELGDWVFIRVRLLRQSTGGNTSSKCLNLHYSANSRRPYLLNDLHQVLQHLPALPHVFVGDDCSSKVS